MMNFEKVMQAIENKKSRSAWEKGVITYASELFENVKENYTPEDVCNDKLLEKYHGNGLNFSTSLGSSGYNHSLNGPLINPNMETIIMSEVAGINHNAYRSLKSPLVLGEKDVIKVSGNFFNCIIGYDNLFTTIKSSDNMELIISLSNKKVRLLNTKKRDYFDRLRSSFIV